MKKYYVFVIMVFLLTPQFIFAQTQTPSSPKTRKVVCAGYALDDKEKLFGNKSQEEINQILEKETQKLMEGPYGDASFPSKEGWIRSSSISPFRHSIMDPLSTWLQQLYFPAFSFFYMD